MVTTFPEGTTAVRNGTPLAVRTTPSAESPRARSSTHESGGNDALAILELDSDFGALDRETPHAAPRAQLDSIGVCPAGVEQRAVNVGTMRDGVRIAVPLAKAFVQRHVDDPFARHAVHHEQALDEDSVLLDELTYAQRVERGPRVGCKLNPGADLREFLRLFEHPHAKTLARETEGAGETAYAAAGDDDRMNVA